MITTFVRQGSETFLDQILNQLIHYLINGWGLVILIGSLVSAVLIAVGIIYWFAGFKASKGRRMVIGGIILFIAMQWLALNPPWQLILG